MAKSTGAAEGRRSQVVTGMFRDRESAERAYSSLSSRGYGKDDVNVIMSDETRNKYFPEGSHAADTELGSKALEGTGTGAAIGGTAGAILGAIAAIGTSVALPGLGLLVAGPLAGALVGAGAGGATGGLIGALVGSGIPEDRARVYEEGVKNGGIVLGFNPRSDEDAEYFEKEWNKTYKGENVYRGETTIPVVEEELKVGKREVERGGVRVESRVTETPVEERVNLREERVHVERHPVDRPVSSADNAFKEGTLEVTERAEQAVVAKEARVVEEVVVGKEVAERTETVRDTVRRTDVNVEEIKGDRTRGAGGKSSNGAEALTDFHATIRTVRDAHLSPFVSVADQIKGARPRETRTEERQKSDRRPDTSPTCHDRRRTTADACRRSKAPHD